MSEHSAEHKPLKLVLKVGNPIKPYIESDLDRYNKDRLEYVNEGGSSSYKRKKKKHKSYYRDSELLKHLHHKKLKAHDEILSPESPLVVSQPEDNEFPTTSQDSWQSSSTNSSKNESSSTISNVISHTDISKCDIDVNESRDPQPQLIKPQSHIIEKVSETLLIPDSSKVSKTGNESAVPILNANVNESFDKDKGKNDKIKVTPAKTPSKRESPLQQCMYMLIKILERKDPEGYFAYPVDDAIAPGYSDIIENPMDFSTIRKKVENNEYLTIPILRDDIKLMCNNAMTYNEPDTIYFLAAKKLLAAAYKYLCKDKFHKYRRTYTYIDKLTPEQIGITGSGFSPGTRKPKVIKRPFYSTSHGPSHREDYHNNSDFPRGPPDAQQSHQLNYGNQQGGTRQHVNYSNVVDHSTTALPQDPGRGGAMMGFNTKYDNSGERDRGSAATVVDNTNNVNRDRNNISGSSWQQNLLNQGNYSQYSNNNENVYLSEAEIDETDLFFPTEDEELILEKSKEASRKARERLQIVNPDGKMGFLRKLPDGTTTLSIVPSGPEDDEEVTADGPKKYMTLANIRGTRLSVGTDTLWKPALSEPNEKITAVQYLEQYGCFGSGGLGPFSSYAPYYDSTEANITKEESDHLARIYNAAAVTCDDSHQDPDHSRAGSPDRYGELVRAFGDDPSFAVEYALSLMRFGTPTLDVDVDGPGTVVTRAVDGILDGLSGGGHSRNKGVVRDILGKLRHYATTNDGGDKVGTDRQTIGDLVSQSDNKTPPDPLKERIDNQLVKASQNILDLDKVQKERLSVPLRHLSLLPQPNSTEMELAREVRDQLCNLSAKTKPGYLMSTQGIHQAMGIDLNSSQQSHTIQ